MFLNRNIKHGLKIGIISSVLRLGDGTRDPMTRGWSGGGGQKLPPRPDHLWIHPASSPLGTRTKAAAGASETLVPYARLQLGPKA
jgi:hypothetical protein